MNSGNQSANDERESEEDRAYRKSKNRLRKMLKLYFYSAVKYNKHLCSFHFVYFLFMLLQIAKLSCIMAQMFNFGDERGKFNNVVKRGHLTLRHLLLKDWDASWETPPYPPAHGDFAVYDITSLKEKVNYAVEKLYNAEENAIGFYKRPRRNSVYAEMKYFDFDGFKNGDTFHGISIKTKTFLIHVRNHTDSASNKTIYSYDVDEDFHLNNITEPIKRMLTFKLMFKIESVRVYIDRNKARCLLVDGQIKFEDPDHNGQVIVDLKTVTERQICSELGHDVPDVTIEAVSKSLIVGVLCLAFISLVYTLICMAFGTFVYLQTKYFMKEYFVRYFQPHGQNQTSSQNSINGGETDLRASEYARFLKGWDLLVLTADIMTIIGNFDLQVKTNEKWTVASLETSTVILGIGCLFTWIGLLRYFKFNYKFHLLFNTIYASVGDVFAYLTCTCILFFGYMSFGYIVLGPYHIKFETATATAETLLSIVNGDELYATFALIQNDEIGGNLVPLIYKIYLGSFIAVFTIIVLNLLIALITNAYDAIKHNREEPEDPEDKPLEFAIKQLLISEETNGNIRLTDYVMQLLGSDRQRLSANENLLRTELQKMFSEINGSLILKRPRTLKAFILGFPDEFNENVLTGEEKNVNYCCAITCFFGCLANDERQSCTSGL